MHKSFDKPSSSSRDARIVKTDLALREALLSLLERKPLDQISIREIADAAGIHYTTFFRHHATRDALLDHVARDQILRLVELSVPVQDTVDTHAAFVALCGYVEQHRGPWSALLNGGAAAVMREQMMHVSRRLIETRERHSTLVPTDLSIICTVSTIIESLTWWLQRPAGEVPTARMAEILTALTGETARSSPKPADRRQRRVAGD